MRKVFLENLPNKYGIGANKDKLTVDWKNSVGYKVHFIYDDIEDDLEIIDYKSNGQELTLMYDNEIKYIKTNHFLKCQLGKMLNVYTKEFKIGIGTTIKDDKRNITIIDREYRIDKSGIRRKWYKYRCNKCPNEDWIEESRLLNGMGCNVCCKPSRKILLGYNTIWDTDRWMCDLGVSEEDAKKYTSQSNEPIIVICPHCKTTKECIISNIYLYKSIGCSCGDGKSYPEKFIYYAFKQLGECFETEYSPEYLNKKRNDFYLPKYNIVVEADGELGHEGGIIHSKSNKTLEECIEVDKWKEEQNLKHGIKTIRINCFESNSEYIKNNILNSELTEYIDFNNVDWNKCEEYALKNIVKEVCDYFREHKEINKENITTTNLCREFNLSIFAIIKYLKLGNKFGWCNYTGNKKKVLVYDLNMNYIGYGESASELDRSSMEKFGIHFNFRHISKVARGEEPHHKGYIFRYAD